jgi:hypothetical protein
MERTMFTAEDIRKRVQRQPFMPFRIMTSSGEHFDIMHPELVMVGRRWLAVGTPGEQDDLAEYLDQVSMLHITAVENLPKAKATKNGKK